MNLTGITDPDGIAVKHFLDSILPLKFLDIPDKEKIMTYLLPPYLLAESQIISTLTSAGETPDIASV